MVLLIEIALFVYGIAALVRGEVTLSSSREARGLPAYFAGLCFLAPLPLAFTAGIVLGVSGQFAGVNPLALAGAEVLFLLSCAGIGMGIAFAGSTEADSGYRKARRRLEEPAEEDDIIDVHPDAQERISTTPRAATRPATRTRWDEEEDAEAPRRRSRWRDEDEDEGVPSLRKPYGGGGVIAVAAVVGVLLLLLVGVAGFLLLSRAPAPPMAGPPQPPPPPPPDDPKPGAGGTVRLPGRMGAWCVSGPGDHIILHMPGQRQLAVFDTAHGRITATTPADGDLLVAACIPCAVTLDRRTRVARRYALPDLEKEAEAEVPMKVPPVSMAMGAGNNNPGRLCISGVDFPRLGETVFLDTGRMQRVIGLRLDPHATFDTGPEARVFASYFGRHFACQEAPGRKIQLCLQPQNEVWRSGEGVGELTGLGACGGPTPLGTTEGLFQGNMEPLALRGIACVPACGPGREYLSVTARAGGASVTVHGAGGPRVFNGIEGLPLGPAEGKPSDLGRRLFYVPASRLLIVVPQGEDRLVLHRHAG